MDTVSANAGIAGRGHLFDIIEAAVLKQPGNALCSCRQSLFYVKGHDEALQ